MSLLAFVLRVHTLMRQRASPVQAAGPAGACTLLAAAQRLSNLLPLHPLQVRGELGAGATQRVLGMNVTIFYVEPPRAMLGDGSRPAAAANWLKLRAFGLTQYDAVLLVDSNAYITGDISPLFNLPTDFAAGWDQVRLATRAPQNLWGWLFSGLAHIAAVLQMSGCLSQTATGCLMLSQPCLTLHLQARWLGGKDSAALHAVSGGALFLRPCATTEAHMLSILRRQGQPPRLPRALALGGGAEQLRHSRSGGGGSSGGGSGEAQDAGLAGPEHEFLAW